MRYLIIVILLLSVTQLKSDCNKLIEAYIFCLKYNKDSSRCTNAGGVQLEKCLSLNKSTKKTVTKTYSVIAEKGTLPLEEYVFSSPFGYRTHPIFKRKIHHNGVDLSASKGTRIKVSFSGKVVFTGWKIGYGNTVIIQNGNFEYLYAHLNEILVIKDKYVIKDTIIGTVGSTGLATGPHLHFEIRKNGKPIDPESILKF